MSFTGSLLTYENNNDIVNKTKKRCSILHSSHFNTSITSNTSSSMGKTAPSSLNSSISNSVITNASGNHHQSSHPNFQQSHLPAKYMNSKRKHANYNNMYSHMYPDHNNYLHLNSLWSIWYGVLLTLFQGYLAVHGAYRFLGCSLISWKIEPVAELNLQIILSGLVFILLPFFFTSAVFKVGNLANDGIKLATGAKERRCSMAPHDGLEEESRGGTWRTLWTHGGPTAAFIHIVIAMCLLLPRLLLESRIIENGLLPRETIWQTELDFMTVNRRNLVVLSVVASPYQNNTPFESQEDDDYFNDTMFTAYSRSGGSANNLLDNNSKHMQHVAKEKNSIHSVTGKTKYFELPDLIAGSSKQNTKKWQPDITTTTTTSTTTTTTKTTPTTPTMRTTPTEMSSTTSESEEIDKANSHKMWKEMEIIDNGGYTLRAEDVVSSSTRTTTTPTNMINATPTPTPTPIESITDKLATFPTATTTDLSSTYSILLPRTSSSTTNTIMSTTQSPDFTSLSSLSTKHDTHHIHQQHHHHNGKTSRKHHRHRKVQRKNHLQQQQQQLQQQQQSLDSSSRGINNPPKSEESPEQSLDLNNLEELEFAYAGGGNVYEHRPTSYEDIDYGRARAAVSGYPKSLTTITATTTRDSNIHIVKPEKLPEIIPSTPLSSNSKIIEIKTKIKKKIKREISFTEENHVEIEPEYLVGDLSLNDSSEYLAEINTPESSTSTTAVQPALSDDGVMRLDGFAGMLQLFFGIEKPIDVAVFTHPPSAEFVNLLFALLVWCVRYPAVFWTTAKSFATIFSVQMIAAAADIIFSFVGISNLYKLQIFSEAQPIQNPGLILNASVTLALFLLATILMLSSSMILYLYGHGRLAAKMRDRSVITLKSSESWIYFAHCASLCYVLALAVVKAPLLNDLSATYRYNLHCPTFMAALVSVMHIFLWIVIWLGLTVKRRWSFKLPPLDAYAIIGKATTQPLLMHNRGSLTNTTTTVSLNNSTTIGVNTSSVGDNNIEYKMICENSGNHLNNTSSSDGMGAGPTEDIYWPKLTPSSPKLKVTFNEVTSTSDDDHHHRQIGDHEQNDGKRNTPRGTTVCFTSAAGEIDDGEYATLRSATAATVVGIALGSGSGAANNGNVGGQSPASGLKILHMSEFDELPPPPPLHMISSMTITNHTTTVTINPGSDYVNCIGSGGGIMMMGDDNISEEGKLLACVRDDSVTYASTNDLEPPLPPPPPPPLVHSIAGAAVTNNTQYTSSTAMGRAPQAMPEVMQLSSSPEQLVSPLAPVTVTVHTNEAHIASSSTPRCLRRADSGVPQEALTPRSETTSTGTESTISPPERAPSESSSGVHSAEEREIEVVIRPRVACKPPAKPPQPAIQEEPYGRCTNMRMSSFAAGINANSATLPLQRSNAEQKFDYSQHCSTMPLPLNSHSHQQQTQPAVYATSAHCMSQSQNAAGSVSSFKAPMYANSGVAMASHNNFQQLQQQQHQQHQEQTRPPIPPPTHVSHTTLPNGVRYSNPNILRRMPYVKGAESPYGHLGLGSGHHTFSKIAYESPLVNSTIPEDRDSANYSMTSDQDCLYATANALH